MDRRMYVIANRLLNDEGEWVDDQALDQLTKKAALKTQLQPHQQRVVDKITQTDQPGLVVAHGLGSGKTLAAIAAQDALQMPASVVLPAALRANYLKEQKKHIAGPHPETEIVSLEQTARTGAPPANPLMIVDEAHRARTPGTKTNRALKSNEAEKRLLLTGSPFYNHPVDIAPLVNMASGDATLPESKAEFAGRYVLEKQVSPGIIDRVFRGVRPGVVEQLNPKTRGELEGILGKWVDYHPSSREGFPEVTQEDVEVPMTPRQLSVYDSLLGEAPAWVAAKIRRGLPPSKQEAKELNSFMSGVRQVSNSTRAYEGTDAELPPEEPKIDRAFRELKQFLEANPRAKAAVYSNWLESGIAPYRDRLTQAGIPFGEFTGEMDRATRDALVQQYNEGKIRALLLSSAGGEGLDLKGTRLMQMLDPHFNEEKINQVIGRGARYLSHADLPEEERNVRVQRFISTRPKHGLLERVGLKKPGLAADQYLKRLAADKGRLNSEFTGLLEEVSQRAPDSTEKAAEIARPAVNLLGRLGHAGDVSTRVLHPALGHAVDLPGRAHAIRTHVQNLLRDQGLPHNTPYVVGSGSGLAMLDAGRNGPLRKNFSDIDVYIPALRRRVDAQANVYGPQPVDAWSGNGFFGLGDRALARHKMVHGLPVMDPETALEMKTILSRPKDASDINMLKRYLADGHWKAAAAPGLGATKEQREAQRRVDAHFKSDNPAKWDDFIKNVRRKSFVGAVQRDLRTDEKLQRHADQMNRMLTGKTVGRVKGRGDTYRVVQLRGSDALGCTCGDWRYRRSVADTGDQDCKHITAWRQEQVTSGKPTEALSDIIEKKGGFGPDEAERQRSAALHEVAGLGMLMGPPALALSGHAAHAMHLNGPIGSALQAGGQFIEKSPAIGHGVELAGLGVLMRPSIQELRQRNQPVAPKVAAFEDEHGNGGPANDYISTQDRAAWRKRFPEAQCTLARDKDGYYCRTHRARSPSFESVGVIPEKVVRFVSSTS